MGQKNLHQVFLLSDMKLFFTLWMLNLWNFEFVDANLIVDTIWKIVKSESSVCMCMYFFSSTDVYMHLHLHKEKCSV